MQVLDECQAALGWLEEKENLQSSMKKTEDPVLVTADIKKKEETLTRVADPILNKPAPKPKVSQQSSTAFTNFHVSQQSGANFPLFCKPIVGIFGLFMFCSQHQCAAIRVGLICSSQPLSTVIVHDIGATQARA